MGGFSRFLGDFGKGLVQEAISPVTQFKNANISTVLSGGQSVQGLISNQTGYTPGLNLNTGRTLNDLFNNDGSYKSNGAASSYSFNPTKLSANSDRDFLGSENIDLSGLGAIPSLTGLPNPLSDLELPTYHLTLMLQKHNSKNVNDGSGKDKDKPIILVESGMTGFSWQELILEDAIGPDFRSRSLGAKKFTLRINEALGMTLFDRMVNAAAFLGVENWAQAPWYLKIEFIGYDKQTGDMKILSESKKEYMLFIQGFNTVLTETGSIHTIEAVEWNDQGNFDNYHMIPANLTLQGDTVGEVLQGVINEMNRIVENHYGKKLITYKIDDLDYSLSTAEDDYGGVKSPFKHKLGPEDPNMHNSRHNDFRQIGKGTDIGELVNLLMANSPTAPKMVRSEKGTTRPAFMFHRIHTHVKPGDLDPATKQYYKEITFTVYGYENYSVMDKPESYQPKTADQLNRFERMAKANRINKVYDYLFTGLNTEVINFDFKVNMNFVIPQSLYKGRGDTNFNTVGPLHNPVREQGVGAESQDDGSANTGVLSFTPSNTGGVKGGDASDLSVVGRDNNWGGRPAPLFPATTVHDPGGPQTQTSMGLDGQYNNNRSFYSMMLNQFFKANDGNFQDLNLEIRGDPYWLSQSLLNSGNKANVKPATSGPSSDFMLGEQNLLLRVRMPQGMDYYHNPSLGENTKFTGFFGVNRVTSVFRDGKFTQTLQGYRLPLWQLATTKAEDAATAQPNTNQSKAVP